ncbi:hypothetical protein [[Eubacterium] cellulosolvens]
MDYWCYRYSHFMYRQVGDAHSLSPKYPVHTQTERAMEDCSDFLFSLERVAH